MYCTACDCINGVCASASSTATCACNAGWGAAANGTQCAACASGYFASSSGDCLGTFYLFDWLRLRQTHASQSPQPATLHARPAVARQEPASPANLASNLSRPTQPNARQRPRPSPTEPLSPAPRGLSSTRQPRRASTVTRSAKRAGRREPADASRVGVPTDCSMASASRSTPGQASATRREAFRTDRRRRRATMLDGFSTMPSRSAMVSCFVCVLSSSLR